MGHNRMIKQETLVNWFKKAEKDISAIDETVLKDPEQVFNPLHPHPPPSHTPLPLKKLNYDVSIRPIAPEVHCRSLR